VNASVSYAQSTFAPFLDFVAANNRSHLILHGGMRDYGTWLNFFNSELYRDSASLEGTNIVVK
jgi:hypothetical protein